jgi:hypothetical protein
MRDLVTVCDDGPLFLLLGRCWHSPFFYLLIIEPTENHRYLMDKSLYHSDQPIMAVQIFHLLLDVYSGITRYPVIP